MPRRLVLFLVVSLLVAHGAFAQSGGQLWVRSFEDRNGDGVRNQGEPVLTRGISVNLLNAEGVIIASALLDESPNAGQGLVGFQLLPPGQYSVSITSANYTATAQDTFTTTVSDTGVPPVLEFGAQPLEIEATPPGVVEAANQTWLLVAAAAALAVICGMAALGFLIYMLVLRRRLRNAQALDSRTTTGTLRPVPVEGTGEFRRTGTGQFTKSSGTGEFRKP